MSANKNKVDEGILTGRLSDIFIEKKQGVEFIGPASIHVCRYTNLCICIYINA